MQLAGFVRASLQQNPDLCCRLGENGLAKTRRSFTVEKIVAELRVVSDG